ncbi:MAG: baseplate J/gp47 family protein [Candidatus Devosia phytovorans]|uniref:Baseplate J/gp47 family protein n=1 Tax=Candidatus Devosia phytovorans TaxID=3121372 RepID=A0AAJ5VW90_9HYPH|nr:baseplate J/gp47 family protein [Devosia sp.]WEK04564.1 MAG: baseplate J/gp47 family protein [Devosia sp.]
MTSLPPELTNLPAPTLVEEISFDALYASRKARLVGIFAAAGIPYDVQDLETDPTQISLQEASFNETLQRQRINEAVRSYFLPFSGGTDLDALAGFYDVVRLVGEDDHRLMLRVVVAIQGRSTGGTVPRYKSIALAADIRVADAAVYTVGRDPTIHVAVFSTASGGVADAALLAKVNAALQAAPIRMVNDTIVVASAAQETIPVTARIWLLPQAPQSAIAAIEANLRTAWARDMLLGRDLTESWLKAQLQRDGVHSVELVTPAANIEIPFNRAAALGAVTLTLEGRSY